MEYRIIDEEKGRCLECGNELGYGRTDRKYCCESCKNKYHNRETHKVKAMQARVMNSLNKNYKILEKVFKMGLKSIDISDIIEWGFNLEYSTSYRKVRGHNEYRCFDFKYYLSNNRLFNLQRLRRLGDIQKKDADYNM